MPANTARKTTPAKATTRRGRGKQADDATTAAPVVDESATDEATVTATNEPATDNQTAEDATPDTTAAPDSADNTDDTDGTSSGETDGDQPDGDATEDEATPVSAAPAKKTPVDRKILMIAAVLGDYPSGVTIADIADECGLGPTTVDKFLFGMEHWKAAVRLPADPANNTPELWALGTGRATDVDMANLPAEIRTQACAHCGCTGHNKSRSAGSIRRASTVPGFNSDGHKKFGKGELRALVLDLINELPGHELTYTAVTKELEQRLGRTISSGAVDNNLVSLSGAGKIAALVNPMRYTANPADESNTDVEDNADGADAEEPKTADGGE